MAKTFPFQCRVLGLFSGLGFPCVSGAMAKRIYPTSEVRGGSWEELPHAPKPEARGGGREDQPHVQGAVAAQAQEGLEELSHVEGQEGRW